MADQQVEAPPVLGQAIPLDVRSRRFGWKQVATDGIVAPAKEGVTDDPGKLAENTNLHGGGYAFRAFGVPPRLLFPEASVLSFGGSPMAGLQVNATGRQPFAVGKEFTVSVSGLAAADVDTTPRCLWICPAGKRYAILRYRLRYHTASGTGSAAVDLQRVPSGTAIAADGTGGTFVGTAGIVVSATAATNYYGTPNNVEGASGANIVESGEAIAIGRSAQANVTSLVGLNISFDLVELPSIKGT